MESLHPSSPTVYPHHLDPSTAVSNATGNDDRTLGLEPVEFDEALAYVNKIKYRFASQPDTYKQFLEILQVYQRESRHIKDVYDQVIILFKSAPDLVEEFEQFLPTTSTTTYHTRGGRKRKRDNEDIPKRTAEDRLKYENAMGYINKVKVRHTLQPDIYNQFLEIFQVYQRGSRSTEDVYNQVKNLFKSTPDLFEEFKQFIPEHMVAHCEIQAALDTSADTVEGGGEKRRKRS